MPELKTKSRRRSERGNWLVVSYRNGKIDWCTWVQTWAGVQASKRNALKDREAYERMGYKIAVKILDIERMVDFAVTEGANEIHDLEALFNKP
jgi:hypothetical protein